MKSLKFLGIVGLVAFMAGCTPDWARQNDTGLLMTVAEIVGEPGGTGLEAGHVLFSDVSQWVNDDAVVTVSIFRKNPTVTNSSPLEDVRLESYQVRYFRSDGQNVEGVDVPHRITGPLSSILLHAPGAGGEFEADVTINVVRHTAKREPPLINLIFSDLFPNGRSVFLTGAGIITTVAEITIYARQVTTGEPLSATGRLQIAFADFADTAQ